MLEFDLNPTQQIFKINNGLYCIYIQLKKYFIFPDYIKRLATPKEVEEYWRTQQAEKYNL